MIGTTAITLALVSLADGFHNVPAFTRQSTELRMGLFDGVKDAFSAPALERSTLDAERETPIDRWMGWSVARDNDQSGDSGKCDIQSMLRGLSFFGFREELIDLALLPYFSNQFFFSFLLLIASQVPADFVDAMDESNYVAVALPRPMGIVFEENDESFGGIFVQSIKEGGVADKSGVLMEGDQLVAVNTKPVHGLSFDDALGAIVDAEGEKVKIVFFRGGAKQFYGPTGASKEWLSEFIAKGAVEAASV